MNPINKQLLQINPYDEDEFRKKDNSWFLSKVPRHTQIAWDKEVTIATPRAHIYYSTLPAVTFYYLEKLLELDVNYLVDIGCGENIFNGLLPVRVHGIDPTNGPRVDEVDFFDEHFSAGHKDTYNAVFAINSLHFIPLDKFEQRIYEFANTVAPGGRGYITFNIARMLGQSKDIDTTDAILYCDKIIRNLNLNLLVVDQYYKDNRQFNWIDNGMDGSIRLLFQK